MKPFPLPMDLRNLADGRQDHWVTLAPFAYFDRSDAMLYVVPYGFGNDLASVPRMAWPMIDPTNKAAKAALVHDWLYASRGLVRTWLPKISRAKADAIFRRALVANDVSAGRALVMWSAVRVGGAKAWREGVDASPLFHSHIMPAVEQMIREIEAKDEPGPEQMGVDLEKHGNG